MPQRGGGRRRGDYGLCVLLAVAHGLLTFLGSLELDPRLYGVDNLWFEGDPPRIYANMTDRWSHHGRQFVHPLFSLIGCTPPYLLAKVGGLDPLLAVRLVGAAVAAAWSAALFGACRMLGSRRLDSALFTLLGMCSASALFWMVVPESYPYGSVSILLALAFVAAGERRPFPRWCDILVNAMTFWFTVTNWMVGILVSAARLSLRNAALTSLLALALTSLLWLAQREIYPTSYFFGRAFMEAQYALPDGTGGPLRVTESFFAHSMVMPEIVSFDKFEGSPYPIMTTQQSHAGSGGVVGAIAVALWATLLLLGLRHLLQDLSRPLHKVLGLSILGQLLLHLLYGDETFLYSLHFLPMLLLLAALPLNSKARPLVLTLAVGLLVCAGWNNLELREHAIGYFARLGDGAAAE